MPPDTDETGPTLVRSGRRRCRKPHHRDPGLRSEWRRAACFSGFRRPKRLVLTGRGDSRFDVTWSGAAGENPVDQAIALLGEMSVAVAGDLRAQRPGQRLSYGCRHRRCALPPGCAALNDSTRFSL